MRIIGGTVGGIRLASPPTDRTRPTGDRVREALFSMLGPLDGAVVVDAYAGSGALGLEALSRGAEGCYFFDTSREAIATIRENTERTGFGDRAIVHRMTFRRGLDEIVDGTPDLWFLDPPYGGCLAREALEAMEGAVSKVTPGTLVVWESDRDESLPSLDLFEVTRTREYGRTRLAFFRRIEQQD